MVLSRVLRIKMASTSLALFVLYSQVKPLETSDFTALKDLLSDFFFFNSRTQNKNRYLFCYLYYTCICFNQSKFCICNVHLNGSVITDNSDTEVGEWTCLVS